MVMAELLERGALRLRNMAFWAWHWTFPFIAKKPDHQRFGHVQVGLKRPAEHSTARYVALAKQQLYGSQNQFQTP